MKVNHRNLYWFNVKDGKVELADKKSYDNKLALIGKDNDRIFVLSEKKEYEVNSSIISHVKEKKGIFKLVVGGYYNYPSLMEEYNHAKVHDTAEKLFDAVGKNNGLIKPSQVAKLQRINNKVAKFVNNQNKRLDNELGR